MSEANARLVAAAPDLLAELRNLVNRLDPWHDIASYDGARAAIQKATGPA